MLKSEALSQILYEAAVDLGGRSALKGPILVMSQHGQSCALVRFDRRRSKASRRSGI